MGLSPLLLYPGLGQHQALTQALIQTWLSLLTRLAHGSDRLAEALLQLLAGLFDGRQVRTGQGMLQHIELLLDVAHSRLKAGKHGRAPSCQAARPNSSLALLISLSAMTSAFTW